MPFFRPLLSSTKDKGKGKGKVMANDVQLTRRFRDRLPFKKERRVPPPGPAVSEDTPLQVEEDDRHDEEVRTDAETAPVAGDVDDSGSTPSSDALIPAHSSPEVISALPYKDAEPEPEVAFSAPLSPSREPFTSDETILSSATRVPVSASDVDRQPTPHDYLYYKVLGTGTEGMVFAAIGRRDRQRYAVKVVDKDDISYAQRAQLFMSQHALKTMKGSPFIIDLQAAFETHNNFISIFPLHTTDLRAVMCPPGLPQRRFSEEHAQFYIAQLIIAVEHLHKKRIIHRDIKPENVLITQSGDLVLTDFGYAHAFGRTLEEQPWRDAGVFEWQLPEDVDPEGHRQAGGGDATRLACGSLDYMAPEVLGPNIPGGYYASNEDRPNGWYSYAADIWSLGVILYELVQADVPHCDDPVNNEFRTMVSLYGPNAPLKQNKSLGWEVRHLISRMLDLDPSRRATLSQIKNHLWFRPMNWDAVVPRKEPPYRPVGCLDCLPIPDRVKCANTPHYFGEVYSAEDGSYFGPYTSPDHLLDLGSLECKTDEVVLPDECPGVDECPGAELWRRHCASPERGLQEPQQAEDQAASASPVVPAIMITMPSSDGSSGTLAASPSRSAGNPLEPSESTPLSVVIESSDAPSAEVRSTPGHQRSSSQCAAADSPQVPASRSDCSSTIVGSTISASSTSTDCDKAESIPLKPCESIPPLVIIESSVVPTAEVRLTPQCEFSSFESAASASPQVPASSDCSMTMVTSILSMSGAPTYRSVSTISSATPSSAGQTSVTNLIAPSSSSPRKPWIKRFIGAVKRRFKPAGRGKKAATEAN